MTSLSERLQATKAAAPVNKPKPKHPTGFEPGHQWDGNEGWVNTGPVSGKRPTTWDAQIRDAGFDPDGVEVIEPVQVRGWDSQTADGVVRMHYYRLSVRRRTIKRSIDELVRAAKRKPRKPVPATDATNAYVVALGDLQLGKADGDGVEGTVARFLDKTRDAADRYRKLRKAGVVGPLYLLHLGDCVEGFVSQGGDQAWRTTLTITEQVRLYRRLLIEQVKTFAPLTDQMVMAGVPGNHDEAHRPIHTYSDSWAIESIAAVRDALELAGTYGHVTMLAPQRDELTLTLDVCGTIVGLAHGHQARSGDYKRWWQGQMLGRQPIGDADLLIFGHLHHLRIERESRSFWQTPALESESTWFRHRYGGVSEPGIITAVVGGGTWSSMEVL